MVSLGIKVLAIIILGMFAMFFMRKFVESLINLFDYFKIKKH